MALTKVRVLYRASYIQFPLIHAMEKFRLWENNGLDVELTLAKDAYEAEELLEAGKVDYVFGNHISPYRKYFVNKLPYVYLGQTVKHSEDLVITRSPISGLAELAGMSIYKEQYTDEHGHVATHPALHVPLYLERAHVLSQVNLIEMEGKTAGDRIAAVSNGAVDAAVVSSTSARIAQRHGLHTLALEPLPMVVGVTLLSLFPQVQENPERAKKMLRTLKQSLECFRTDREACIQVLKDKVAPKSGFTTDEEIDYLYESTLASFIPNLIPSPESVLNVYKEACIAYPEVSGNNPMELWDMHFALELTHE